MLDHGGDLETAIARFGGRAKDWIDLSTGINRQPYPLPPPDPAALHNLPRQREIDACARAALAAYGAAPGTACLPLAGAQAAIRLVPALRLPGRAAILGPTYNEHAAAFAAAGWQVTEAPDLPALRGFDAVVVVNPNNPDGRRWGAGATLALRETNRLVIVDESFADVAPEVSICPAPLPPGTLVLRSFGKFYGLAGLRLGFALGAEADIARLRALTGHGPASARRLAMSASAPSAKPRRRPARP